MNFKRSRIIKRTVSGFISILATFAMYGSANIFAYADESDNEYVYRGLYNGHIVTRIDETGNEAVFTGKNYCLYMQAGSPTNETEFKAVRLSELESFDINQVHFDFKNNPKAKERLLKIAYDTSLSQPKIRNYAVEYWEKERKWFFQNFMSQQAKGNVYKADKKYKIIGLDNFSIEYSYEELYNDKASGKITQNEFKVLFDRLFSSTIIIPSYQYIVWWITTPEYLNSGTDYISGWAQSPSWGGDVGGDRYLTSPVDGHGTLSTSVLWNFIDNSLSNPADDGWDAWVYIQKPGIMGTERQNLMSMAFKEGLEGADYMSVQKTDENGVIIGGATFELYDSNHNLIKFRREGDLLIYDANGTVTNWVSKEKPQVIRGLHKGDTYYLREENAPDSYSKVNEDKQVIFYKNITSAEENPYVVSFVNSKGFVLPETGENGTESFIIVGSMILLTGFAMNLKRKKTE